jgi:hypothetical protein
MKRRPWSDAMVRMQIRLTEEQLRSVKEQAAQKGISVPAYIRRALDATLERDELVARSIAACGSGHSGLGDVSIRHDDYFVEAILDLGGPE